MIAIPLDEKFCIGRGPYWAWNLLLGFGMSVINTAASDDMTGMYVSEEAYGFMLIAWLCSVAAQIYLGIGRARDAGINPAHGWWVLVPFGWVVLGCLRTKQGELRLVDD